MMNMAKALMEKINNMQKFMDNVSRNMKLENESEGNARNKV